MSSAPLSTCRSPLRSLLSVTILAFLLSTFFCEVARGSTVLDVPCCPSSTSTESCTITIDAPTTSDQVAVAQNCNHPSIGMVLRFKSNVTKFVLRNSKVKHVTLEPGAWLHDVHVSIESTEVRTVAVESINLADSSVVVRNSSINQPLLNADVSGVRVASSQLTGSTTIEISSCVATVISGQGASVISLENVVAAHGTSILIRDLSSQVVSSSGNATAISIGNSTLIGFAINATSWTNEATSAASSSGSAGLIAVHSSSTASAKTSFMLSNVTSISRSADATASAFGIKLSNVRAEPSDDKPDELPLDISFKGTLSVYCESSTGKGVGANLFHIHDSALHNVAIRGYGEQSWKATSTSQDARSSLYLLDNVQGRNVTLTVENAPLSIFSKGHATTLMLVDDVALTDLDVTLSGVDLALTSSTSTASLMMFQCSSQHCAELRSPTMRILGSFGPLTQLPTSLSQPVLGSTTSATAIEPSTVLIDSYDSKGCLMLMDGSLIEVQQPLWRNLGFNIDGVESFQCTESGTSSNYLLNTANMVNATPIGTTISFRNSNLSVTAKSNGASTTMFYLKGVTTNFSVTFDGCSVHVASRVHWTMMVDANLPGTLRSPQLLTIANSNVTMISGGEKNNILVYLRGVLENKTTVSITKSRVEQRGKGVVDIVYRFDETDDLGFSVKSSVELLIIDCERILLESLGNIGSAFVGLFQAYFDPFTVSNSATILRSNIYLHSMHGSQIVTVRKNNHSAITTSPSIFRFEDSYLELDAGQSIVLYAHPAEPPVMNLDMSLLNCTINFHRRISVVDNLASIAYMWGCLGSTVHVHGCEVSVLGYKYRGAPLITVNSGGDFDSSLNHSVNITASSFLLEIAPSKGTSSDNFVCVASVETSRAAIVAVNDVSIDYSSQTTTFSNSLFQLHNCTPNCAMTITNADVNIHIIRAAHNSALHFISIANNDGGVSSGSSISLDSVAVNIHTVFSFYGLRIWGGVYNDAHIKLTNCTLNSHRSSSAFLVPLDINNGRFNRLDLALYDLTVLGYSWHALLLVTSVLKGDPWLVDSSLRLHGVLYESEASAINVAFLQISKGRDMYNTTIDISNAVVDIATRNNVFGLNLQSPLANRSTVSFRNSIVRRIAANYLYMCRTDRVDVVHQSSLVLSNISVENMTASFRMRGITLEHSKVLSGSEFRFENLRMSAHGSSTRAIVTMYYLQNVETEASAAFVLRDATFNVSGTGRNTYLVSINNLEDCEATFQIANVAYELKSQLGSNHVFYLFYASFTLMDVQNINGKHLHASSHLGFLRMQVPRTKIHSTIRFLNVSFPDVFVGHTAMPLPTTTPTSSSEGDSHVSSAIVSRPIDYRFLNFFSLYQTVNTDVTFEQVEFKAGLADDNGILPGTLFDEYKMYNSSVTVRNCKIRYSSINSTNQLSSVSSSETSGSFILVENSTIELVSELKDIVVIRQFQGIPLHKTLIVFNNTVIRCRGGGNYIFLVYTNNGVKTSENQQPLHSFLRFHDVKLVTDFLIGSQRSLTAQQLGDDGLGNISPRRLQSAMVAHSTQITGGVGYSPAQVEFNNVVWTTTTPSPTSSVSPPNMCLLFLGLSNNIHLAFNSVDMQCHQQTAATTLGIVGNVEKKRPPLISADEPNPHVGNVTISDSDFRIHLGPTSPATNLTIDDNVSTVISYEIGFPAVVNVENSTITIINSEGRSSHQTLLWSWMNVANSTVTNDTSLWMPFPRITFSSSTFTNVAHAILPPAMSSGSRPVPTTEYPDADIRINCTWLNGKRLTAPYFSTALPASAISYHPSLVDQEHRLCPVSATISPSPSQTPTISRTHNPTPSLSVVATETKSASDAGTVTVESTTTVTTSLNESSTASTTLLDALPWCRHAHIQMVVVEEGSEAQTMLELDREVEADSAYRNVSAARVSLSTLNDATVLAYLFLTNDTAASWTSLAVEAGRVRVVCGSGTEADECGSSLREAEAARPVSAELVSAFLLRLRLGAWGALYLGSSGVLEVRVGDAAVGCSELGAGEYVQQLIVDVAAKADEAVQAAATSTIAAASVVGAAASPAMLMDAQSLATFSLISCSSGSDRYAMQQAMFLLSPFSLGPEPEGFVWTNLMFLSVLLVPFLLVISHFRRKAPENFSKGCVSARFPSMYFMISMILHQGTAVLSMRMLFDGRWSAASVIGTLWAVLFPALIYITFKRKVTRDIVADEDKLVFYRYDGEVSAKWPKNALRWLKRYAFPVGRWGPSAARRQYGGPVNAVLPTWTLYATLPLAQAVLVSFVASIQADSMTGCMAQYAVLTLFFVTFGVAVQALQPFRARLLNVFQAASYFILAAILACSAALAYNPRVSPARSTLSVFLVAQTGLSLVRTLYLVPLKVGEWFFWKQYATTTRYNELRDNLNNRNLFFEAFGRSENSEKVQRSNQRKPVTMAAIVDDIGEELAEVVLVGDETSNSSHCSVPVSDNVTMTMSCSESNSETSGQNKRMGPTATACETARKPPKRNKTRNCPQRNGGVFVVSELEELLLA